MKLQLFAFSISTISLISVVSLPILAIANVYQTTQARVHAQTLSLQEPAEPNDRQAGNTFNINVSNTTLVSGNLNGTDTTDLIQFAPGPQVNAIVVEFSPKVDANLSLLVIEDSNHNGRIDANDILVYKSSDRPTQFKNRETILTSPGTHFLAQITKTPNTPGSGYHLSFTGLWQ